MSSLPNEGLCAAFGMRSPAVLDVTSPDGSRQRHVLAQPFAVVGRDERAALRLEGAGVSRRHVYLQAVGGRLFAIDLESTSGTTLDGAPARPGWFDPGQRLGIAGFEIENSTPVAGFVSARDPFEDPLDESGSAAQASFDVFLNGNQMARWRMNRVLSLVGRSALCRVRLRSSSVSRVHCGFVATPQGVWVVDLLSREGTRMHDEPVRCARLEDGDSVQIGSYRLRIVYDRPPARTTAPPARQDPAALPAPPMPALAPSAPPPSGPPMLVLCQDNNGLPVPQAAADQNQVVALVQQFNAMQQNMFDQFQRTVISLVQMFSSMHQEQASLIREEMARFQKATDELNRLQQQMRDSRPAPTAAAPSPPVRAAEPLSRAPAVSWSPPTPAPPREAPVATPPPPVRQAAPAQNGGQPAEAVHGWLNQRIEELQSERQSSWQRILTFIRGA